MIIDNYTEQNANIIFDDCGLTITYGCTMAYYSKVSAEIIEVCIFSVNSRDNKSNNDLNPV